VGADEVRVGCESGMTEARDFTFYAADVGDKGAGREVGGDLPGEGDDLVYGGSEDDEVGATDGFVGRFRDGVTPRLIAKFQPRLGTARPKDNARRDTARPGGTRDGSSEEAGGEDRELSESAHRGQKTQKRRTVSSPTAEAERRRSRCVFRRRTFLGAYMAYTPTRQERLDEAKRFVGPVIAGLIVVGVAGWVTWRVFGPVGSPTTLQAPPKEAPARAAALQRVAAELEVLERTFQRALDSGATAESAGLLLNRVIEKQRELMRLEPAVKLEQTEKLARMEGMRGSQRSRVALARSLVLEKEAIAAQQAGQTVEATEKMREALQLQHEANASAPTGDQKDLRRESRLMQELDAGEAEPLRASVGTLLTLARSAAAQERWDEALNAFTEARKIQADLNQRFAATRVADRAGLDRIDSELQSLRAAGLAAVATARERDADMAATAGRAQEAAASYAAAVAALREVNQNFPRSRFASEARVAELEVRRQTVLSRQLLSRAADLEREITASLRRRHNSSAVEKLSTASALLEKVAVEFPRSESLNPMLQRKIAYLALRAGELDGLQVQVLSRLAPLPGNNTLQMLKIEVPQDLYQRIMNENPSQHAGRALPVDSVSWLDTQQFCERLGWLLGVKVRLPTEAEFRGAWSPAGTGTWSFETSNGRARESGVSPASPAGFYDLAGNLAEWLVPQRDGGDTAPVAEGSFLDSRESMQTLRVVARDRRERAREIGFRVVVEDPVD